jgi:hypothetical protein
MTCSGSNNIEIGVFGGSCGGTVCFVDCSVEAVPSSGDWARPAPGCVRRLTGGAASGNGVRSELALRLSGVDGISKPSGKLRRFRLCDGDCVLVGVRLRFCVAGAAAGKSADWSLLVVSI